MAPGKKGSAKIYCNRRGDVEEGTKSNEIKILETNIRRETKGCVKRETMDTIGENVT